MIIGGIENTTLAAQGYTAGPKKSPSIADVVAVGSLCEVMPSAIFLSVNPVSRSQKPFSTLPEKASLNVGFSAKFTATVLVGGLLAFVVHVPG